MSSAPPRSSQRLQGDGRLTGGADTFVHNGLADGVNTVADYSAAQGDVLDLAGTNVTLVQVGATALVLDQFGNTLMVIEDFTVGIDAITII